MVTHKRPLSPHLQIYKPQLTSFTSIMHRATGIFLSLASLMLVYWLMAIAAGPQAYEEAQHLLSSFIGRTLLFAWTLAMFYHLCNGIRHLFWDAGYGFDLKVTYLTAKLTIVMTIVLSLATWLLAYSMRGGI
ncbi:MAG: succinate dehydrogenase, cytochrome b556 subunit [Beggiatoa sp. IS2]|nr:MAG: succinate dehydrogenase, cytochrome b556 subunit [Beggiatoa sp. IS2]